MKTKLTLTVRESVIARAKKYSRKSGKSISTLFEEVFENPGDLKIKSSNQLAAKRLLKRLANAPKTKALNDKALLSKYLVKKYG